VPVHSENGGYQWGHSGKVYHGKGAKEKAAKQGQAVHASGWHGKSMELVNRIDSFIKGGLGSGRKPSNLADYTGRTYGEYFAGKGDIGAQRRLEERRKQKGIKLRDFAGRTYGDYFREIGKSLSDKINTFIEKQECPGGKIRSQGKGRGLGVGRGKGPIGRINNFIEKYQKVPKAGRLPNSVPYISRRGKVFTRTEWDKPKAGGK